MMIVSARWRSVPVNQEPERHQPNLCATGLDFTRHDGRLFEDAEHAGDIGAIHVRVHQTDLVARLGQGHREVGRNGRLAHPALSRRNRDDLAEVGIVRLR
jgi:hypothetical protein